MSNVERTVPEGFERGPLQGLNIIGEVTEALHRFLLDGWNLESAVPRIEEDLSFVPKDREEVLYVYMYRVAQNTALLNSKRWRATRFSVKDKETGEDHLYYERPPIYLELHYLISVHSKFRSELERLLGWLMLRLHEATHLVYRPRRYLLPNGDEVDSTGKPWQLDADGEDLLMEKVGLSLVDDLTVGDAINFFTIHEAPYRPFLTYKARCAMEGALISAPPTAIRTERAEPMKSETPERPSGRMGGRMDTRPKKETPIGPEGHDIAPNEDE
jgi:hypothetical protein